jgi:type I restriction enzyme S subunit
MNGSLVTINSYITTLKGFAFKSVWYTENGVPIVKVSDFTQDSVSPDKVAFIPIENSSDFEKYQLQKGDVLIQTVGSWEHNPNSVVGKVVRVPEILSDSLLNQNIVKIIPKETIDRSFLYYLLKNDVFKGYILNTAQGAATQASITLESIKAFKFIYKDKATQRKIASILSAYDDLIENNLKRIKLLEEKAFVTYKGIVSSEKMAEFTIDEVCETSGGGTPSTTNSQFWDEGEILWFSPTDLTRHNSIVLLDSDKKITELGLQKSSAKLVPPKTILMTSRASIGYFGLINKPVSTNQGFINIIPFNKNHLAYMLFDLKNRKEEIIGNANGSTFLEISKGKFRQMKIKLPKFEGVLIEFEKEFETLFNLIENLLKQNTKLREARDILLPRLMNGQIEVS